MQSNAGQRHVSGQARAPTQCFEVSARTSLCDPLAGEPRALECRNPLTILRWKKSGQPEEHCHVPPWDGICMNVPFTIVFSENSPCPPMKNLRPWRSD